LRTLPFQRGKGERKKGGGKLGGVPILVAFRCNRSSWKKKKGEVAVELTSNPTLNKFSPFHLRKEKRGGRKEKSFFTLTVACALPSLFSEKKGGKGRKKSKTGTRTRKRIKPGVWTAPGSILKKVKKGKGKGEGRILG